MPEPIITVTLYEPWMRDQIIHLTEMEYPFMQGWFEKRFQALYESNYLKNRNHLVVALADAKKVVACISYIYWPLEFKGTLLNSYQMVGLLVDPTVRGKGLFKSVLIRLDELINKLQPDVVFGFPVEASKAGFLKLGWKNNFNLDWYITPVSWQGIISRKTFTGHGFESGIPVTEKADGNIQTATDQQFWTLRENFFPDWPTFHKTYTVNNQSIQIIFRIQKMKGFNVAVIGRIYSGNASQEQVMTALKLWMTDLRKERTVLAATAAVNEFCLSPEQLALRKLMFRMNKKIIVITKSYSGNKIVMEPPNWNLMRGDMETW